MKICIVIKSEAFRVSAGMRIRYDRFGECLVDDDTIEAHTCAALAKQRTLDHDVYIFCKTFDMESLLFARRVRAAGKVVGQDLFDDYFSQVDDARLEEYRDWLRQMAPVTDYAICSTPRMVELLRPFMPDVPIVAVDDPVIGYDPLMIAALADAKSRRAAASRTINMVWFGIGDNPYFPVGLSDLAAFESELARIERLGWAVRLKMVTNARPFEKIGLAALRAFSVEHEVIEWTEALERELLLAATVAVLPVSGQSFSRAKSLNRAITAFNAGCQVLSLGFPLYDRLGDFVYRSVDALVDDLERGCLCLRAERVPGLTATLASLADPFDAAAAFVREARRATERSTKREPVPVCLIHGRQSSFPHHKMIGSLKGLSVATPYCGFAWNFPVRFDVGGGRLRMRVSLAIADHYALPALGGRERILKIREFEFIDVNLTKLGLPPLRIFQPLPLSPLKDLALYEDVMAYAITACRTAFGEVDIVLGDVSPIKLPPATLGRAA